QPSLRVTGLYTAGRTISAFHPPKLCPRSFPPQGGPRHLCVAPRRVDTPRAPLLFCAPLSSRCRVRDDMPYPKDSLAGRLLADDPVALGQVIRWISLTLTSPKFWVLRRDWPDLVQEVLTRVVETLRLERFDASRNFR